MRPAAISNPSALGLTACTPVIYNLGELEEAHGPDLGKCERSCLPEVG